MKGGSLATGPIRRGCWLGALVCGSLLLAGAAPAAADEQLAETGSVAYSWHGDPARGCAAEGLCDVQGSVIVRPSSPADLSSTGGGTYDASIDATVTIRVQTGADAPVGCVDLAQNDASDLLIDRARGGRLFATVSPPPSSGRCAGPLQRDLAALTLPVQKSGRRLLSFDLRTVKAFSAGPFSGSLVSTLVLKPETSALAGGLSGIFTGGSSSGSFFPTPGTAPGPKLHPVLYEHVEFTYALTSQAASLEASFSGEPEPLCVTAGSCGVTGVLALSLPSRYRDTIVITARGVVRKRVGSRQTIADFESGRLGPGSGEGAATLQVTETLTNPDGSTCRATSSSRFDYGWSFGIARRELQIQLDEPPGLFGPGAPLFRSYCPGPSDVDVLGGGPLIGTPIAQGSAAFSDLPNHATTVALTNPGSFDGDGYTGTRTGAIDLALTLERVRAGTERELVP